MTRIVRADKDATILSACGLRGTCRRCGHPHQTRPVSGMDRRRIAHHRADHLPLSGRTPPKGSRSMSILAIDPGNTESGFALIDPLTRRPLDIGKIPNEDLIDRLIGWIDPDVGESPVDRVSIEMIKSYGMPVGATVFETCVWIGRFAQVVEDFKTRATPCELVYRGDVKLHHCHNSGAKDSNVVQALIDRFASGVRNRGKGIKDTPGWFYGFRADIWQAYALAVMTADTNRSNS